MKKAFSVSPVQAVATARTKVVSPKALWMGTRLALKAAVADSQQSSSKKLKNPAMNWKKTFQMSKFDFERWCQDYQEQVLLTSCSSCSSWYLFKFASKVILEPCLTHGNKIETFSFKRYGIRF